MIYFDHNATTPTDPAALEAMAAWHRDGLANPSSVHRAGRMARAAIETARRDVASALGVDWRGITFTSGATEALHLAIAGLAGPGDAVLRSALEHPAVGGAIALSGADVVVVPAEPSGQLDLGAIRRLSTAKTAAVVTMAAQNELGLVYPIEAVVEAAAATPVVVDAAQLWGRLPLAEDAFGADVLIVSGHKIGGPPGTGVLWTRQGTRLRQVIGGGAQERGRRGGTENGPGIVGLAAAARLVPSRLAQMPRVRALRDLIERRLGRIEGFVLHGGGPRLPNTLAFRIEGVEGDLLLAALDLEGVCISSGSACSAGAVEPSPVLRALGLSSAAARGGLRVSLGPENSAQEAERFCTLFEQVLGRARGTRP